MLDDDATGVPALTAVYRGVEPEMLWLHASVLHFVSA